MKKLTILFAILITAFTFETSFSQKDTTIQDAMDFIATNLNQTSKASNLDDRNTFEEIFFTDEDYGLSYDYEGQYTYTVISTKHCSITFVETITTNTKISFFEDRANQEDSPIYSKFGYLNQDTVTINFANIARVESDKNSISLVTYNNKNLIKHHGKITRTPPQKRRNDLVAYLRENEPDINKKFKKYLKKNEINYETYPMATENFEYENSKFIFRYIDKEVSKRLVKALTFLQQHCGGLKEKF